MSHAINNVQDDMNSQGASKCDDVEDSGPCKVHVEKKAPSYDLRYRNQCQGTLYPIGLSGADLDQQCEDTYSRS
jgi:hypothetical protein